MVKGGPDVDGPLNEGFANWTAGNGKFGLTCTLDSQFLLSSTLSFPIAQAEGQRMFPRGLDVGP